MRPNPYSNDWSGVAIRVASCTSFGMIGCTTPLSCSLLAFGFFPERGLLGASTHDFWIPCFVHLEDGEWWDEVVRWRNKYKKIII